MHALLRSRPNWLVRSGGAREAALLAVLFAGYEGVRALAPHDVTSADGHAWTILRWEGALGVPSELGAQQLALAHSAVAPALNNYYVWVHFPLTALFLLWLWTRHRDRYHPIRTALVALTAPAMVLQALVPVTPPRLLHGAGFVDTMAVVGPSAYEGHASQALANQYAAFPSLHVGWALLVAYGVVVSLRHRLRWLALLHPAVTVAVVVMTANHYWLDGLAAGALLLGVLLGPAVARRLCCRIRRDVCDAVGSWRALGPLSCLRGPGRPQWS